VFTAVVPNLFWVAEHLRPGKFLAEHFIPKKSLTEHLRPKNLLFCMNFNISKNLAEHLGPACGTLVFRGTVVGNHWIRAYSSPAFLNPNYSATRFSQDLKLLDTGHSLFKLIFTLLLYPHLKKIFRDCLRSYNKIKYVLLANLFQLRKEKCSLTFLCYFLATRLKSSTSRYWVATRWLRNPAGV
jgi:hypothetical protein